MGDAREPYGGSSVGAADSRDAAGQAAGGGTGVLERPWPKPEEHRVDSPGVGGSSPSPRTILSRRLLKHFSVKWAERLGWDECPYLTRWVAAFGAFSVRLHHFHHSDDARYQHDHPWWFVTLVLRGAYYDVGDSGRIDHLKAGSVRFRRSTHTHTVLVDYGHGATGTRHGKRGGVWTLVLTGPNARAWGFWVNGRHMKANKYFLTHGHHPCELPS